MSNKKPFSIDEDKPTHWFDPLYAGSNTEGEGVPWANMDTHPSFRDWLKRYELKGQGKTALVVGCGMGDDAIELESLGFKVTAFDVSEAAIDLCKKRFPNSNVNFVQADLLAELTHWEEGFDFVLEIYTVQALPPKYEKELIENISKLVALNGQLLVIAEVGNVERSFENGPPWILTPKHVDSFVSCGLTVTGTYMEEGSKRDTGIGTFVTVFTK